MSKWMNKLVPVVSVYSLWAIVALPSLFRYNDSALAWTRESVHVVEFIVGRII